LRKAHAGPPAAALELEDHGEPGTAQALPEGPHYTLEQLLDESWYPTDRASSTASEDAEAQDRSS
jgi:hypothetical protein